MESSNEFLKDVFSNGNEAPPVSTGRDILEPTETQKMQIWVELKAQEEMFRKDRSLIFKTKK